MNWHQFANMLGHIETSKFHMDHNFYSGILLGDAHSKHILIILLTDWWNFRKLQAWFSAFEWDEDRTLNKKPNSPLIKHEFQ